MTRQSMIYGVITGAVVIFVGGITGMGGSFWPNLLFGLAMGLFAAVCFGFALRIGGRKK